MAAAESDDEYLDHSYSSPDEDGLLAPVSPEEPRRGRSRQGSRNRRRGDVPELNLSPSALRKARSPTHRSRSSAAVATEEDRASVVAKKAQRQKRHGKQEKQKEKQKQQHEEEGQLLRLTDKSRSLLRNVSPVRSQVIITPRTQLALPAVPGATPVSPSTHADAQEEGEQGLFQPKSFIAAVVKEPRSWTHGPEELRLDEFMQAAASATHTMYVPGVPILSSQDAPPLLSTRPRSMGSNAHARLSPVAPLEESMRAITAFFSPVPLKQLWMHKSVAQLEPTAVSGLHEHRRNQSPWKRGVAALPESADTFNPDTAAFESALRAQHHLAATVIQAFFRAHKIRQLVWGPNGLNEHRQARNIQRVLRGHWGRIHAWRRRYELRTAKALRIQCCARRYLARCVYHRRKAAYIFRCATLIQAVIRGRLARKLAQKLRFARWVACATRMQRLARRWLAKYYLVKRGQHFAAVQRDCGVLAAIARNARAILNDCSFIALGVEDALQHALSVLNKSWWICTDPAVELPIRDRSDLSMSQGWPALSDPWFCRGVVGAVAFWPPHHYMNPLEHIPTVDGCPVDALVQRAIYQPMVPSDPKNLSHLLATVVGWAGIGCQFVTHDFRRAQLAYRFALQLRPADAVLHTCMAILLQVTDQKFDDVVAHLNAAAAVDPAGEGFRRVVVPFAMETVKRRPRSAQALMNMALILQTKLWNGRGRMHPRDRRVIQHRSFRYFVRAYTCSVASAKADIANAASAAYDEQELADIPMPERTEDDDDGDDDAEPALVSGLADVTPVSRDAPGLAYQEMVRRLAALPAISTADKILSNWWRLTHLYSQSFIRVTNIERALADGTKVNLEVGFRGQYVVVKAPSESPVETPYDLETFVANSAELDIGLQFPAPPSTHVGPVLVPAQELWEMPALDASMLNHNAQILQEYVLQRLVILKRPPGGGFRKPRYYIADAQLRRQITAARSTVSWYATLSSVQAIIKGFLSRNRFAVARKRATERRRQIDAMLDRRRERQAGRLHKILIVTKIQSVFRGLLARKRHQRQLTAVRKMQEWARERLVVLRKRSGLRFAQLGVKIEILYKVGKYVNGKYLLITVFQAGKTYMLQAMDPFLCEEYHGLVRGAQVEAFVKQFPWGCPESQHLSIKRDGRRIPLTMMNISGVCELLVALAQLADPPVGTGDLAREEGRYTIVMDPRRLLPECHRIEKMLEARRAEKLGVVEESDDDEEFESDDEYDDDYDPLEQDVLAHPSRSIMKHYDEDFRGLADTWNAGETFVSTIRAQPMRDVIL